MSSSRPHPPMPLRADPLGSGRSGDLARAGDRTRTLLFVGAALLLFAVQQGAWPRVLALDLPDNDDLMRLAQVRDWLAGQAWFDNVQHRFGPPAGSPMHWSRLVDLPIAGLIVLLRPLVGVAMAEGLAVALWPPLVFAAFLVVLWRETRPLFGARAAGLACLAATQTATAGLWGVGRIDHHNVQATAIAAATLLVANSHGGVRRPVIAGALCALSLGIGLETLPFVALLAGGAALAWSLEGQDDAGRPDARRLAARRLLGFAAALAGGSLVVFAAQVPPSRWGVPECDALSPPWLLLAVGGGIGAAGLAAADATLRTVRVRLAALLCLGAGLGIAFAGAFPACLLGPYAGLPDLARTEWLGRVIEAQPAFHLLWVSPEILVASLLPLLVGFAVALAALRGETGGRRAVLLAAAVSLGAGILITQAQLRGIYIATALLPVASAVAFERAFTAWELSAPVRVRFGWLAAGLATLATVWSGAIVTAEDLAGRHLPATAMLRGTGACAGPEPIAALNTAPPGLVLASTELGAPLLVSSHHAMVAAPYHRAGEGIVAGLAAESGSEDALMGALRRVRPDYLLACADWARAVPHEAAVRRLVEGESVVGIDRVVLPESAGGLRLWRVRPGAFAQP